MTRVFIVEDEFLIAMEMESVVRDLGHECVGTADDLETALSRASAKIDVALVDVNLADGATGPVVGARLAQEFGAEVIFVTANPAQLGDGVDGALGAVEKPVSLAILKDVLNYVMAVRRGENPSPPEQLRLFDKS